MMSVRVYAARSDDEWQKVEMNAALFVRKKGVDEYLTAVFFGFFMAEGEHKGRRRKTKQKQQKTPTTPKKKKKQNKKKQTDKKYLSLLLYLSTHTS